MKITVVGAVLIIAGVVVVLMLLDGLSGQAGATAGPNNANSPDGGHPGNWSM